MKICLITTTINDPTVLELYRRCNSDVEFFVALDDKSVKPTVLALDEKTHFIWPEQQKQWKCSALIGFSNIQRRNIALLEAMRSGADLIISCDDDNICLDRNYFKNFTDVCRGNYFSGYGGGFESPRYFSGIKVSSPTGWFDVGTLLDPVSPHRGFPHDIASQTVVSHVVGARVGLAAGICLGDPDISACVRISRAPEVHRVSELLNSGIVVDPSTHTVFNSQNTAFIRDLAPAFFMLPGVGRYDDIYASLIMQRVMRERGLHVHFGKPFVWQQRNQHNLVKDLRGEIDGMEYIKEFATFLSEATIRADESCLRQVYGLWRQMETQSYISNQTLEAALAFLEDLEGVL